MSNTAFGWNNQVTATGVALAASSVALPVTNLQDDRGSAAMAWQTVAGVTAATLTITPSLGNQTWRVAGLFGTNLTPQAAVSVQIVKAGATVFDSTATPVSPIAAYNQTVIVLPGEIVGDSLQFTIMDPGNPDTFLNVPLAYAGDVWFPLTGASWSTTAGRDDQVDEVVSRGGQEYPALRWQRRRWNISLSGVRASEVWSELGELDRISRAGGNTLFIPDVTSGALQQEAIFGRLQATADVSFPYQGADRRAWAGNLTERI